MNKPLNALLAAAALLASATALADGRPIDERRPLKADAKVSVSNVAGLIEVEAWDRNELHLTGTLDEDVEELSITGDASRLEIEVELPRRTRHTGDTVLKLKLPPGVSLEARAVSADVRVKGLKGRIDANSVSGDVTLDVGSARISAQSVSGDVTVTAPTTELRANSVSGDVTARGGRGDLDLQTVSGEVRVQAREVKVLDAESVSGDLLFDVDLLKGIEMSVETLSGTVELTLASLPDVDIEIETFSGALESAFDEIRDMRKERRKAREERRKAGRGHDDHGDHGYDGHEDSAGRHYRRDGSQPGNISLQSFSGDIVLKKR